jgi:hypothetical protein
MFRSMEMTSIATNPNTVITEYTNIKPVQVYEVSTDKTFCFPRLYFPTTNMIGVITSFPVESW